VLPQTITHSIDGKSVHLESEHNTSGKNNGTL